MTVGPWWMLASLLFISSVLRHESDTLATVRCGNVSEPFIYLLYRIGSEVVKDL